MNREESKNILPPQTQLKEGDVLRGPKCPGCGEQGPSGAKFCYSCGAQMGSADKIREALTRQEPKKSAKEKLPLFYETPIDYEQITNMIYELLKGFQEFSNYEWNFKQNLKKLNLTERLENLFKPTDSTKERITKLFENGILNDFIQQAGMSHNPNCIRVLKISSDWYVITREAVDKVIQQLKTGEKQADILDLARMYEGTNQLLGGIPGELKRALIENLQQIPALLSPSTLRSLFNDNRLTEFLNRTSIDFNNPAVFDLIISNLHDKYNQQNENALVLFLEVLYEHPTYGPQLEKQKYLLSIVNNEFKIKNK